MFPNDIKRRKIILALGVSISVLVFAAFALAFAATVPHSAEGHSRPIIVLLEIDPWAMVTNAESPAFALYSDGTVIYRKHGGSIREYRFARLTETEAARLQDTLSFRSLLSLDNKTDRANVATDVSEFRLIIFNDAGTPKVLTFYGSIARHAKDRSPPDPLLRAIRTLVTFDHSTSNPWLPDFIELLVWPFEYSKDKSIAWPSNWPDFRSPPAVKRGDVSSIYLEKRHYHQLRAILWRKRETQAFLIEGKKWALSYRLPFPQEGVWRESF